MPGGKRFVVPAVTFPFRRVAMLAEPAQAVSRRRCFASHSKVIPTLDSVPSIREPLYSLLVALHPHLLDRGCSRLSTAKHNRLSVYDVFSVSTYIIIERNRRAPPISTFTPRGNHLVVVLRLAVVSN